MFKGEPQAARHCPTEVKSHIPAVVRPERHLNFGPTNTSGLSVQDHGAAERADVEPAWPVCCGHKSVLPSINASVSDVRVSRVSEE
jgi:hypothetical protein